MDFAVLRELVSNLVLRDGAIGPLADTPAVQTAIVELVNAGITGGQIVVPAPVNLDRPSPVATQAFSGNASYFSWAGVLKPSVPGTAPVQTKSGLWVTFAVIPAGALVNVGGMIGGAAAGDLLLAAVQVFGANNFIVAGGQPAGWRLLMRYGFGIFPSEYTLWAKVATGAEPANYSFQANAGAAGAHYSSGAIQYHGVDNPPADGGKGIWMPPGIVLVPQVSSSWPIAQSSQLVSAYPTNSKRLWFVGTGGGITLSGAPSSGAITMGGASDELVEELF